MVVFTPGQFLRRLAALVPPPRMHLVGYHGVFAAGSALRRAVVPKREGARPGRSGVGSQSGKKARVPWAELLRRVFAVDVLQCPCGGTRRVVAFVRDPALAREALRELGLPAQPAHDKGPWKQIAAGPPGRASPGESGPETALEPA